MFVAITYFVHGTTTDNEHGISTGWNQGELSELGKRQCKELRGLLADKKFDAVFCSDLGRAVDSANLIFGEGVAESEKRLREVNYGDLNGAPSSSVEPSKERHINTPFPNGESYKDVEKRVQDFLTELAGEYCHKHVAFVSHMAPQLALEVLLNEKNWNQAFSEDWRNTKQWRPGWNYFLKC
ncbi:MAG: histidine phosphatase family protein [Candidatus Micrarchaeota archaeon]